jgi:hypothetical protein
MNAEKRMREYPASQLPVPALKMSPNSAELFNDRRREMPPVIPCMRSRKGCDSTFRKKIRPPS